VRGGYLAVQQTASRYATITPMSRRSLLDTELRMASFRLETMISAPLERCFDLSRDVDLHVRSMRASGERAVAGKTSGLLDLGDEVTWEARHFGLRHRHASRITAFDRPRYFRDEMVAGRFASFRHDHYFESYGDGTRMIDGVSFASPLGVVGRLVDSLFLRRYLMKLIAGHNDTVRREAESGAREAGAS
jgi:ligand-binding SRPBCC domain-containing protein